MPVGAAIGSAVGAVGGAVIGGSAQKKAAKTASAAQENATAQQVALGKESLVAQERMFNQGLGLNKDIYKSNYALLSPYVSNGMAASDALQALLGLPKGPTLTPPALNTSQPTLPTAPRGVGAITDGAGIPTGGFASGLAPFGTRTPLP